MERVKRRYMFTHRVYVYEELVIHVEKRFE